MANTDLIFYISRRTHEALNPIESPIGFAARRIGGPDPCIAHASMGSGG
jgi:hypothetical protein